MQIIPFLKKYQSYFYIFFLGIFLILYTYKLNTIPTNITGDESTYLGMIYRILFSKTHINPFMRMEDTKPALDFYWMGLWIKAWGLQNSIFAMRFSVSLLSMGTLILFFLLLKKSTSPYISFITTILLGSSLWFFNFARSSWLNSGSLLFGLLLFFVFFSIQKKKTVKGFLFLGFIAGCNCYGYLSGYLYPLSLILYLACVVLFSKEKKRNTEYFVYFLSSFFLTIIPLIIMFLGDTTYFLLRPQVVFIGNNIPLEKSHDIGYIVLVYLVQIIDVVKGLFFMDSSPIGRGVENLRYYPFHTSALDLLSILLFWAGAIGLVLRKISIHPLWIIVYALTLFTVGALTVDPPNLARTITALPSMYFLIGLFIFNISKKVPRLYLNAFFIALFFISLLNATNNISTYFIWITSSSSATARQPAIEYDEFLKWQDYQIKTVKSGGNPISNYQWYEIRKTL